jgi:hypothetical protein
LNDASHGAAILPIADCAEKPACAVPRAASRAPRECGPLPFLIKRDATWLYRGSAIGRKELVCLFASVLNRAEDGTFWLETPAERGTIEVEDAPFLAVELDWTGLGRDQVLNFRTNVDEIVSAGPEHPIRVAHDILTCEPTPYLFIRPGAGRLPIEARISRAVYYELVALSEVEVIDGRRMLGVWSNRRFFPLGEMPCCEDIDECDGCESDIEIDKK